MPNHPDLPDLFQVASGQQGYFTSAQARTSGVSKDLVTHHVRSGRFIRVYRGVYRFRDYPDTPRGFVAAAWLAAGKDHAVVSHESALDLHDLTDVIPRGVHLTVPRSARYARTLLGVTIHTTSRALVPSEITIIDGVRVTSATRTIMDAATAGTSPEHIEVAVRQSLERGITTRRRLREAASTRSKRVRDVIAQAIDIVTP